MCECWLNVTFDQQKNNLKKRKTFQNGNGKAKRGRERETRKMFAFSRTMDLIYTFRVGGWNFVCGMTIPSRLSTDGDGSEASEWNGRNVMNERFEKVQFFPSQRKIPSLWLMK